MKVIALTGYSKAGKDFVGNMLKDYYSFLGYKTKLEKFATPLREFFTEELVENKKDEEFDFKGIKTTPRELMIAMAKGMKQFYGEDVFAKALVERIINDRQMLDIVVITDLRFNIEQEYLLRTFDEENVCFIKIERKDQVVDPAQEIDKLKYNYVYNNDRKRNFSKLISFLNEFLEI